MLKIMAALTLVASPLFVATQIDATACDESNAKMVADAITPTSIGIYGIDIGHDAMQKLWDIVAAPPPVPHNSIGIAIAKDQNWSNDCSYPGIGIGAGSGNNLDDRNVTLWIWAVNVDLVRARTTVYALAGVAAEAPTTTTSTAPTTTTTTTAPPTSAPTTTTTTEPIDDPVTTASSSVPFDSQTFLAASSAIPTTVAIQTETVVIGKTIPVEPSAAREVIRPDAKSSAPGLASGAKQKLKGCGVKKSSTCQVKNIRRQVIKSPSILKNRQKTPMNSLPKFRTGHSSRSLVNSKTK
jgi:hypothetical protein